MSKKKIFFFMSLNVQKVQDIIGCIHLGVFAGAWDHIYSACGTCKICVLCTMFIMYIREGTLSWLWHAEVNYRPKCGMNAARVSTYCSYSWEPHFEIQTYRLLLRTWSCSREVYPFPTLPLGSRWGIKKGRGRMIEIVNWISRQTRLV